MDKPLSEILRPLTLSDFIGQEHLLAKGKPIQSMIEKKKIYSMILWGPPGCGKTTLARLVAKSVEGIYVPFSAVTNGVKEVREIISQAKQRKEFFKEMTVLFIDEIHRFNKSQQDAFLPAVEDGTITLIGATTENPGFEINAPLISRSHVYVLKPLEDKDILKILKKAITHYPSHKFELGAIKHIVKYANGDARSALNAVELATSIAKLVSVKVAEEALQQKSIYYDKKGDSHYDTISAFIKSMRGSKPDATLHYLARMLKAGEDPMFIARRMVIFASEDVGNASPTAIVLANSTMQAVHMVGMPEAQIILAQCATYLATAKKSTASYDGINSALQDLEQKKLEPIPLHLRNASNKVTKEQGYGNNHVRYPWKAEKEGKKVEQEYMPNNLKGKKYYKIDWK